MDTCLEEQLAMMDGDTSYLECQHQIKNIQIDANSHTLFHHKLKTYITPWSLLLPVSFTTCPLAALAFALGVVTSKSLIKQLQNLIWFSWPTLEPELLGRMRWTKQNHAKISLIHCQVFCSSMNPIILAIFLPIQCPIQGYMLCDTTSGTENMRQGQPSY